MDVPTSSPPKRGTKRTRGSHSHNDDNHDDDGYDTNLKPDASDGSPSVKRQKLVNDDISTADTSTTKDKGKGKAKDVEASVEEGEENSSDGMNDGVVSSEKLTTGQPHNQADGDGSKAGASSAVPGGVVGDTKGNAAAMPKGSPKKTVKKIIYAKLPRWTDIPDWKGDDRCRLMELPNEIMNLCFGYAGGGKALSVSDYVALSGTSRFFRHYLDDDFFREICYAHTIGGYAPRTVWDPAKSTYVTKTANAPSKKVAARPFTRGLDDWRKLPEAISLPTLPSPPHGAFYIPPGDPSTWTDAQREVHDMEKAQWERATMTTILKARYSKSGQHSVTSSDRITKDIKYMGFRPLAFIDGRKHGQPAVTKDAWGIPLPHQPVMRQQDGREDEVVERAAARLWAATTGQPYVAEEIDPKKLKTAAWTLWSQVVDPAAGFLEALEAGTWDPQVEGGGPDGNRSTIILPRKIEYDSDNRVIPHNHWPSKWRAQAVSSIHDAWINKTDALQTYKISEAELITLRHVLIHNPMSPKSPRQMYAQSLRLLDGLLTLAHRFLKAAVRSLAFRAHGGEKGHELHLKRVAEASAERKNKAIAKGTYKCPFAKCNCGMPWYYRRSYGFDLCECDRYFARCDACDKEHVIYT